MRSLRARLTLGLTVVLAAVLVLAGWLAARDVERSEREALDDRLVRTAELSGATALEAVQEEVPSADDRLDAVLSATRTSLRLLLGDAPLIETGDPAPRHGRLPKGLSTFESGGVRFRAYVSDLRDPSLGGLARLELTTRLTALEDRQERLRNRLVLIGLLALALAAAGVFAAGGVVLRPLRRLRGATARIAGEEDLGRRVDDSSGATETRALASSFNAMLSRLSTSAADRERAIEATRRFAADAGHELRTPLTSIQARLDALARHPDEPPERRTAMAAEALAQQRRVVALLDGLQALARGDAAPELAPLDLADVVDAALAAARERHARVDWSAEVPEGRVEIDGWEPGLRSLLDNLLENAARHGAGAAAVTLRGPELVVEDDGPGIPEDERARIFEPFVRLDDEAPGSGLGLALVAQQARHHGATVTVERSERLGGARFSVRFPARARAAPQYPAAP
ncbi:MAG TPA: HAMP domain-containing sensor histidine kinase [Solirubrobacteraceae bacterium]|nr:HAMP domain-containing sensor histidine kinase [Solirubrobacteraceae bacterium]